MVDSNKVYTFTKKDMEIMWNKRIKADVNADIEKKVHVAGVNTPSAGACIRKVHLGDRNTCSTKPKKKSGVIPI